MWYYLNSFDRDRARLLCRHANVFLAFNLPVNKAVASWNCAALPADWTNYRARWEWSHAVRAVLAFTAFICLLRGALTPVR